MNKPNKISEIFHGLLLAISFLTRIPVETNQWKNQSVWRWSFLFYPLAGFIIGAIACSPLFMLYTLIKGQVIYIGSFAFIFSSSFAYLAISAWMSRLLHFDGFCDCIDAFSAMHLSKDKRLEIMKDPHIGSSAVGAAIILFIGKFMLIYLAIFYTYFFTMEFNILIIALIFIPGLARFAILILAGMSKYPRKDGTGFTIVEKVPLYIICLTFITLMPFISILGIYRIMLMVAMSALSIFYWRTKAYSKIEGVTGDVLGGCCETVELSLLLTLLIA